ncbi:hypothetical protein L596_020562 [Steinernema carpocapsae]|uniref:Uncharacterized protein n=1 Tax=Steinernema carpocapsae TaxID=34508 RepID=A0A4U5MTW7_STECR|nr:hypothetical protein L596_020562 [Steinernema carpocapsae]
MKFYLTLLVFIVFTTCFASCLPHYNYLRQMSVAGKATSRRIRLFRTLVRACSKVNPKHAPTKAGYESSIELEGDSLQLRYPQKFNVIGFGRR